MLVCLVIAAMTAVDASAQVTDAANRRLDESPRHHEWVDVKAPADRTVRTWVVYPEVDRSVAAVVIIHENRGLNDWARSVADRVAEAGYVALAPDLLSGTGPDGGGTASYESSDAARNGIYELPAEQVIADLEAVVAHARSMDATTDTVSVAGFCWGGGQVFRYATHDPDVAAAFVFYGRSVTDEELLKEIEAPVYGFYGGEDFRITGGVSDVAATMTRLGKTFEPVVYDGAGHAFMRRGEQASDDDPNRKAHDRAWRRWISLLSRLGESSNGHDP